MTKTYVYYPNESSNSLCRENVLVVRERCFIGKGNFLLAELNSKKYGNYSVTKFHANYERFFNKKTSNDERNYTKFVENIDFVHRKFRSSCIPQLHILGGSGEVEKPHTYMKNLDLLLCE